MGGFYVKGNPGGAIQACCDGGERDKVGFSAARRRVVREVAKRVAAWYATVTRDTVVAAHGGVARALMANFIFCRKRKRPTPTFCTASYTCSTAGTLARYS